MVVTNFDLPHADMQEIIPYPPNVKFLRSNRATVGDIREATPLTDEIFKSLKKHTQVLLRSRFPSVRSFKEIKTDHYTWNMLLTEIKEKLPEVCKFQNSWVVELYANCYLRSRIRNGNPRNFAEERARRSSQMSLEKASPRRLPPRLYVGKPPPRLKAGRVSAFPERGNRNSTSTQNTLVETISLQTPVPPFNGVFTHSRTSQPLNDVNREATASSSSDSYSLPFLENGLTTCYRCGFTLPVLPSLRVDLDAFLSTCKMEEVFGAFSQVGIVNDKHYQILLKWSNARRETFFCRLVEQKILTAYQSATLLRSVTHKLLGIQVTSIPAKRNVIEDYPSAPSFRRAESLIPRPSPTEVAELVNSDIYGYIMKVINFSEKEAIFWELLYTIRDQAKNFAIDVSKPFKDQPKWQLFTQKVAAKHPRVREYEDLWVIEILLRHNFHRTQVRTQQPLSPSSSPVVSSESTPTSLPGTPQVALPEGANIQHAQTNDENPVGPPTHRAEDGSPNEPNSTVKPELPPPNARVAFAPCIECGPLPSLPMVSKEVIDFLRSCGMEEAWAVFSWSGIVTGSHLDMLLKWYKFERQEWLRGLKTRTVRLNQFQIETLEHALQRFRLNSPA